MYCAKCGAQNEAIATDCSKCGEALQKADRPSKFKGTMMMSSAPEGLAGAVGAAKDLVAAAPKPATVASAGPAAPTPNAPTMKKTMVGVAAVGATAKSAGAPAGPTPNKIGTPGKPGMNKTMVGVSPFAQAGGGGPVAVSPKPTPAKKHIPKKTVMGVAAMGLDAAPAPTAAPAETGETGRKPLESGPAPKGRSPNLKQTMIGVSPFGDAAPKATPKPVPKSAAEAAPKKHVPKKTMMGVAAMGIGAAPSPTPPKAAGDAAKPNLKKTMVGVSPFGDETSAAVTAAAAAAAAGARKPTPKKTVVGMAAIGFGLDTPSEDATQAVDMKATMIGTSPFGEPDTAAKTEAKTEAADVTPEPAATPNFKRTVAFGASNEPAAAPEKSNPAFKGTMVGMMPVGAEQAGGVDATVAMPQIDPSSMEPVKATPAWAKPAAAAPEVDVHRVIGTTRTPALSILWMILVVPGIIQFFRMLGELNRFRAQDDVSPWPFFVPVLSLIKAIGIPEKLREAKEMAGIANATAPNVLLFLIVPGPLFAASLNEIWQSARNNAP